MMNNNIKAIVKQIKKAKNIAVFTHINPDFDALSSALSLVEVFNKRGKKSYLFSKDKLTDNQESIYNKNLINSKCNFEEYDLFISVDVPTVARLGDYGTDFIKQDNTIVLDHHENNGLVGSLNYIDIKSSSCAEIVFKVLKNLKYRITSDVATLLYSGLAGDTNSFINSNVNEESFKAALELMKLGADINKINEYQFKSKTKKEIEFIKYLWDNVNIVKNCAYCLIDYTTLKSMKGSKNDCDFYSTELIKLRGVNYSFSIIEDKKGIFSISLRSKSGYDVKKVAEKLNGGGHVCAAGAKINAGDIQEAKNKVISIILK